MIQGFNVKKRNGGVVRVKWWNLTKENVVKLVGKIKSEASWKLTGDADEIWDGKAQCIRRSAREVVGVSKGGGGRRREAWWWNEGVREKVRDKHKA